MLKISAAQVIDKLVRPERFELPASWFVARRSIQLSYGRALNEITAIHGGEGGIARRCAPRPFAPLRDHRRSRSGVSLLNRSNSSPIYAETQRPAISNLLAEREGFEP